jgi:branched-chain amino acid transport system substrate-binding protein
MPTPISFDASSDLPPEACRARPLGGARFFEDPATATLVCGDPAAGALLSAALVREGGAAGSRCGPPLWRTLVSRWLSAGASALLLAAVVAAPSSAQVSGQVAGARVSGDVVRIGVLNDQSGMYADFSGTGSVLAARLAIEDAGRTVLGKPVELVVADHQNKPDVGAAIARKWYEQDGVDLIVDVPTSSVMFAVQEVARAAAKPLIVTTGGTSDFTGKFCSPVGVHWVYDTYGLAVGTGRATVERQPGKSWFFLTADYAFGHALERDTIAAVRAGGGTVLGSVLHPQGTSDFSSFLLQAQAAKPGLIAIANAGTDTTASIKQAGEFGVTGRGGAQLVALFANLSDIHALGLEAAQGLILTQGFYWNLNDETRAWSKRYFTRQGAMPNQGQAGVYSAVRHYLQAVAAAGTDDGATVAAKQRDLPVDDFFAHGARIRADGKLVHDLYLLEVKKPSEAREPWDYLRLLATIPGEQAARPLAESDCPLVRNTAAAAATAAGTKR